MAGGLFAAGLYFRETRAEFVAKLAIVLALVIPTTHHALLRWLGARGVTRVYFRLGAMGLSILVVAMASEFALRLYYRDVTTSRQRTSWFSRRWYREAPPIRNTRGFREREFTPEPPQGVYRIALIGDSFGYGQGIPEADRLGDLLQDRLDKAGGGYEVLTFCVPGAETKEQLVTLREDVLPVKPHAIIQQWFTNDVRDWAEIGPEPAPRRLIPSDVASNILHRHSVLYFLLNERWSAWQYAHGLVPSSGTDDITLYGDARGAAWIAARQRQIEFIETCRNAGLDLSVVLYPQLTESLGEDYPSNFLMDRIVAILEEYNVPYVDLRKAYSEIRPVSELWANEFDWHPNRRANIIAADLFYDAQAGRWAADRAARIDATTEPSIPR